MTEAEFEAMTPHRYYLALRFFNKAKAEELKHSIEMTRVLVTTYANTYAKNPKTGHQLWPLPWDKENEKTQQLLQEGEMTKIAEQIWQEVQQI